MVDQPKDLSQNPTNSFFMSHSNGIDFVLISQPLNQMNYMNYKI